MNPAIEEAKRMYRERGLDLNRDLSDYIDYGYVFSLPDRLLLVRPVLMEAPREWFFPSVECEREKMAWYVHLAIGRGCLRWFAGQMPYYLPALLWLRQLKNPDDGRLHCIPTDRFLAKLKLST